VSTIYLRFRISIVMIISACCVAAVTAHADPGSKTPHPPNVAPATLETSRTAGSPSIPPDEQTQKQIISDGRPIAAATVMFCIDEKGVVKTVKILGSSGYQKWDDLIQSTISAQWRFRPFVVDGAPSAVCTAMAQTFRNPKWSPKDKHKSA
jgi:hypothetical protein